MDRAQNVIGVLPSFCSSACVRIWFFGLTFSFLVEDGVKFDQFGLSKQPFTALWIHKLFEFSPTEKTVVGDSLCPFTACQQMGVEHAKMR